MTIREMNHWVYGALAAGNFATIQVAMMSGDFKAPSYALALLGGSMPFLIVFALLTSSEEHVASDFAGKYRHLALAAAVVSVTGHFQIFHAFNNALGWSFFAGSMISILAVFVCMWLGRKDKSGTNENP